MIHVFKDAAEASQASADLLVQTAREAVARGGRFTVALTGGSSPVQLYQLLATPPYRDQVPWAQTFVFWGDERAVPHADERNNARMAFNLLLDHVPVPPAQIHRMSGELPPDESARRYEALLKAHFGDGPPQFDLILLGMGDDGHTASMFPGTEVVHERERWVKELYLASQNMYRITLTAPLINRAHRIVFQVFGAGKAATLKRVLEGPYQPDQLPSQLIKPSSGELHWFLDEAAGS
ncbi:MAG TPA: 6-phosphogluconolactonase, partial [Cytophagales bacterium]